MLKIRQLVPEDQKQLWTWLHIALWDPPPAPLRPIEILKNPHVRIYAEEWGNSSDVGVVCVLDDEDIGACWMRLLPKGVGMASIDDSTPQLGIAILPEFQGKGYGTHLMRAALKMAREHGYRNVSLTVHPENPAIKMYKRCGFVKRELRNTYHLMVADLTQAP